MQLLRRKKNDDMPSVPAAPAGNEGSGHPEPEGEAPDAPAVTVRSLQDVRPAGVRRDTLISPGGRLNGALSSDGNIVVGGEVEGNITGRLQVRVESGGRVRGDIHAQQIMISGHIEGSCHADTVMLMAGGRIEGDIITDELAIEKGGLFTGHARPAPAGTERKPSRPPERPAGPVAADVPGDGTLTDA